MDGKIIYTFPVLRAIEAGYVKRLRAKMLKPSELLYIDRSDGQEKTIGPDEVRALGEIDAEFRRGIVMSERTLTSLVDQSINELLQLRKETGEKRLKIIASALNLEHCIQITEAFRTRGYKAEYVHSRENQQKNENILKKLENHEIDVIVQARMLGEGFDHRWLSVALIGNIYSNLSPFVQFVGRIMRSLEPSQPGHPLNQGVVVFHIGANVAKRWDDFRQYSQEDQDYFSELLPEADEIEFEGETVEREPGGLSLIPVEIIEEKGVLVSDLPPIGDPQAQALLQQLSNMDISPEQAAQELRRLKITRQDHREARRHSLNEIIQNETGGILGRLNLKHRGRTLDPHRSKRNFEWIVSELHRRVNEFVGGKNADRQNFTLDQLNEAHSSLPDIVRELEGEIRNATS